MKGWMRGIGKIAVVPLIIGLTLLFSSFIAPGSEMEYPYYSSPEILLWRAPEEVRKKEILKEQKFLKYSTAIVKKFNPELSWRKALKICKTIYRYSVTYGYDPYFILSIVKVESSFDPHAISPAGAVGLMQIMPDVGKYLADLKGESIRIPDDLFDIETNIRLGVYYFKYLHMKYRNIKLALLAYNMGPGTLNFFIKNNHMPTNDYHQLVLEFYSRVKKKYLSRKF